MQEAEAIQTYRFELWNRYHRLLEGFEKDGLVQRPQIPSHCEHNAHMYYILLAPGFKREQVLKNMTNAGVGAVSHYVPLHSSPAGREYGRAHGSMENTDMLAERIVRLPLWVGMTEDDQQYVVEILKKSLR